MERDEESKEETERTEETKKRKEEDGARQHEPEGKERHVCRERQARTLEEHGPRVERCTTARLCSFKHSGEMTIGYHAEEVSLRPHT